MPSFIRRLGAPFWIIFGSIVFLATRLINLTGMPIFTDEAIYIRWSQIGSRDAAWRFISLTDGKQPFFTWVMMAYLKFIHNPLAAGRLVSVTAGALSIIGIYFLAHLISGNRRIGLIASPLYLLFPFAMVYDRMALYDAWVAAFSIWNLYLAIRLVREIRLDIALIFGLTLGLGMLNKTSGFFSLYLVPFTLLLFDWHKNKLGKWMILVIISAVISQALYSILRLSPLFHMISQKDAVFVYPFREWLVHPFLFFYGNIVGLFDWLLHYMTIPIFFASFAPLIVPWYKLREKLLLYLWWLLPFMALALFGRILYPRFILFMTMPLLVLAAFTIDWIIHKFGRQLYGVIAIIVLFFPSVFADYFIVTNPLYAIIPYADKGQYVDNWPSGWGVSEVVFFLRKEASNKKITVYTEGTFGLFPYALEIYLVDNPNIKIHGIWPLTDEEPAEMVADARSMPTYFVLNQVQSPPERWALEKIFEVQKGSRTDRKLRFYKVLPAKL